MAHDEDQRQDFSVDLATDGDIETGEPGKDTSDADRSEGEAKASSSGKEQRGGAVDIFGEDAAAVDGEGETLHGWTPPEIEGIAWEGEQRDVYNLGAETAERLGIDRGTYNELAAELIANFQGQETGIPETPDGYTAPKIEGIEWSDADKPVLDSFMGAAHSVGLPQATVDHLTGWFYQALGEQQKAQKAADQTDASAAREALRGEWGAEAYTHNLAAVKQRLDTLPDDLGSILRNARDETGRRLINNPTFVGMLLSRENRTPPTRADRKAKIEAVMRTDMHKYWSTPGLDEEYQQILAEEEKSK